MRRSSSKGTPSAPQSLCLSNPALSRSSRITLMSYCAGNLLSRITPVSYCAGNLPSRITPVSYCAANLPSRITLVSYCAENLPSRITRMSYSAGQRLSTISSSATGRGTSAASRGTRRFAWRTSANFRRPRPRGGSHASNCASRPANGSTPRATTERGRRRPFRARGNWR